MKFYCQLPKSVFTVATLILMFSMPSIGSASNLLESDPYNQAFLQMLPNLNQPKQLKPFGACNKLPKKYREWCNISEARKKSINDYYSKNSELAKQFVLGPAGHGQVPFLIFRSFEELFPNIWGYNQDGSSKTGLFENSIIENPVLPLGVAMAPSMVAEFEDPFQSGQKFRLNNVSFNCLSCHANVVEIDPSKKKIELLLGAPNTRIDNQLFLVAKTSGLPDFNAEKLRSFINQKPEGWFYNSKTMLETERRERAYLNQPGVMEEVVTSIKVASGTINAIFQKHISPIMYSKGELSPNPFSAKRGSMDALLPTYLNFAGFQLQKLQKDLAAVETDPKFNTPELIENPELREKAMKDARVSIKNVFDLTMKAVIPANAAESDSTSIWNQKGRGGNHWDGGLTEPMHRNTGSAAATLNKPVNLVHIKQVNQFIDELPSDPYPFNVDMRLARRGETLFKSRCMSCHASENRVISWNDIRTDRNRLDHFTPGGAAFLPKILKLNCFDPKLCSKSDGSPYSEAELVKKTDGYVGGRLDGIWARAPYLHNGSVPNLRDLLTNERPKQFFRGSIQFDQENVGYVSDKETPGTVLFDTTLDGNSNVGHDYEADFWRTNEDATNALIEYLKTL